MKRVLLAAVATACVLQFSPAVAAGPYDGSWSGTVEGSSVKCPPGAITMSIAGDKVTGNLHLGNSLPKFEGSVTADGAVTGSSAYPEYGFKASLTGKISGGDFAGTLDTAYQTIGASCSRNVSAKRS